MGLYHEGNRKLQDRFDTRRLADRIEDRIVHDRIDDGDRAFIAARDMFFIATVDEDGQPQCSYKGGDPGFVRVLDERTIAFPIYDGNGMYLTAGNVLVTRKVGLLFIDFEGRKRMRLNGVASVNDQDPLLAEYPEAQLIVRVEATGICGSDLHIYHAGPPVEAQRMGQRRPRRRRSRERSRAGSDRTGLSRRDFLRRATAVVLATRLRWVEQAFASTQGSLAALVEYVVGDRKLVAATTPRLIRTLDRFLPGPQPLSATAASILDGAAAQVKPGATFAKLTRAQQAQVFATLERLPVESAGSIRFLVGNLQDLTAFLAYSTPRGWRLARYAGSLHGHKEFKGYWQGHGA